MNSFQNSDIAVSVVLPCQNEEAALGLCLEEISEVFHVHGIRGEIIVSDSSCDRSPEIARAFGARVVKHDQNGYGRAYLEAFKHVRGDIIFCADPDGSYEFTEIPRFIDQLKNGADLVLGNRFGGTMATHAMPWLHRVIGRPLFSNIFWLFYRRTIPDIHNGMRAFRRHTLDTLALQSSGMELASEMLVAATRNKLKIAILPINYRTRLGKSKLRTFTDGLRHLRYLLRARFIK